MDVGHSQRAHRLMAILDGIREGLRANESLSVESSDTAAVPHACGGEDHDLPGCAAVRGAKTTEIARRMLFKALPTENPREYKAHTTRVWKLFTKKEMERVPRVTVHNFRDIAKRCPPILGTRGA